MNNPKAAQINENPISEDKSKASLKTNTPMKRAMVGERNWMNPKTDKGNRFALSAYSINGVAVAIPLSKISGTK